jgi:hypothetical protein
MTDAQLDKLWQAVFKRPIDPAGLVAWRGKPFDTVIKGILASPEHKWYTPVFQAIKALEASLRRQEW